MSELVCACGHVLDEHVSGPAGAAHCAVEGCPCVHFDEDPEVDE